MLRFKWVADQLGKRKINELIGREQNVWLLSSGPGSAAKVLEDDGYQLTARPVLYGHILLSHYAQHSR